MFEPRFSNGGYSHEPYSGFVEMPVSDTRAVNYSPDRAVRHASKYADFGFELRSDVTPMKPPLPETTPQTPGTDPTVLLIRHGESEANAGLPTPSPVAIRLTEKGRAQASTLAESFDFQPDLVIVSPFIRTRETAAPLLAKYPGAPVEEWPIQEFTYLDTTRLAGTTEAERRAEVDGYWTQCDAFATFGNGAESFAQFVGRVDAMISRLRDLRGVKVIAVFTHGYVMHAAGLRLREPDTSVDADLMRRFRHSWTEDAPAHCEVREFRFAI